MNLGEQNFVNGALILYRNQIDVWNEVDVH